jgi:arabinose-5-phosphate isomerase
LYLTVGELSRKNKRPSIDVGAGLKEVILEISGNMLGATAVLEEGKLVGVITDGDLRRMLEHDRPTEGIQARDIAGRNPKSIEEQELAVHALELMRQNDITQLIVTRNGDYAGMVHLHDLIREGLL